MSDLTPRQQQVYTFLSRYIQQHGFAPSLREIAAHLGVSGNLGVLRHLDALEHKGYICRNSGNSRAIVVNGQQRSGLATLPLVGTVRAGLPQLAVEEIEAHLAVDPSLVRSADSFLLRVKGESMIEAHICDGDLAVVRPQAQAENGAVVVALVDGEATLKRFFREGDRIRLQPENRTMAPIIVREGAGEVAIVGLVTGLLRVVT